MRAPARVMLHGQGVPAAVPAPLSVAFVHPHTSLAQFPLERFPAIKVQPVKRAGLSNRFSKAGPCVSLRVAEYVHRAPTQQA